MFPIADVAPAVKLIYATIIFAALIVFAIYLKTRLDGRGVRVYAIVTNRLNPPGKAPSGLSGHNYMIFAKWTNPETDRKSTRLNSSHTVISYAVFCLKKKKKAKKNEHP